MIDSVANFFALAALENPATNKVSPAKLRSRRREKDSGRKNALSLNECPIRRCGASFARWMVPPRAVYVAAIDASLANAGLLGSNAASSGCRRRARPKSRILTRPPSVSITFCGFKSR